MVSVLKYLDRRTARTSASQDRRILLTRQFLSPSKQSSAGTDLNFEECLYFVGQLQRLSTQGCLFVPFVFFLFGLVVSIWFTGSPMLFMNKRRRTLEATWLDSALTLYMIFSRVWTSDNLKSRSCIYLFIDHCHNTQDWAYCCMQVYRNIDLSPLTNTSRMHKGLAKRWRQQMGTRSYHQVWPPLIVSVYRSPHVLFWRVFRGKKPASRTFFNAYTTPEIFSSVDSELKETLTYPSNPAIHPSPWGETEVWSRNNCVGLHGP